MDHTITLPVAKVQVSFRSPKVRDKKDAIQEFSQENAVRQKGYNLEESIAARCITQIQGNATNNETDLLADAFDVMVDWEFLDQQYYMEVFSTLYFLDEKGKQRAADEAKKIMGASTS